MQYFFTDFNAITNQEADDAYGPQLSSGGVDNFLLENRFSVNENAPAIAICKSLLLAQEDSEDNTLLNIALIPLEHYFQDIPIKFIIYRGIKKDSLYDAAGVISTDYSGWKPEANLLFRIQQIQNEINTKNQQNITATKKYLGCQIVSEMYLEQAFFISENPSLIPNAGDLFYPIVVEGGFMIGKFAGGTKKAAIQFLMDKLGHEPMLSDLRKSIDSFQVPALAGMVSQEVQFKNRYRRQKVLSYIDYCALLGGNIYWNSNIILNYTAATASDNALDIKDVIEIFQNKTTIYFDIRDDYGNSHNSYYDTSDIIKLMARPEGSQEFTAIDKDYYEYKWPICQFKDYQTETEQQSEAPIKISVPILPGDPVWDYYAYNYTTIFGNKYSKLKSQGDTSSSSIGIQMNYSNEMELSNPVNSSGKFYSNYHLIKLSSGVFPSDSNPLSQIFPLTMNNLIGDDDLEDGDFKVYTYSSVNAPIIRKDNEVYVATIGVAKDKYNVTFFTFKEDGIVTTDKVKRSIKPTNTGKFNFQYYLDEFEYQPNQALGFLTTLPFKLLNQDARPDYDLKEFSFGPTPAALTSLLAYVKVGEGTMMDSFFKNFDAICISHIEYMDLLNKVILSAEGDYYSNFKQYFSQYLMLTRLLSSTMSETFIQQDFTVFRYYPAFMKLTSGLDTTATVTDKYSIKQDELGLLVHGRKTADVQALVEQNLITSSVILNSIKF